ncbi:tRNA (adenosine(37)-N6)-threonylcarbamoyltransferase complex dimerization subunit type 1 TsaB [Candidatus Sumerlaeota bacterium]|nr:tRNA (adenosine(37)-N6)-threonylcarbamoyltransferase complex dimerization subunit type 1 TsaB [Candidatus Sumerlaeota bacterium]
MNLLAFETATPRGGAALIVNGTLIDERMIDDAQAHSRFCLHAAEQLVKAAGFAWADIDVFAASHGPGSFTGVRVGLTLAKSLAYAAGKKVVTVSSLAAIAHHAHDGEGATHIVPLIDARMDEVYGAIYKVEGTYLAREPLREFCATPGEVVRMLTPTMRVCGEGARRYEDLFHANLGQGAAVLSSPGSTAQVAWAMLKDSEPIAPALANAVYWRDPVHKP